MHPDPSGATEGQGRGEMTQVAEPGSARAETQAGTTLGAVHHWIGGRHVEGTSGRHGPVYDGQFAYDYGWRIGKVVEVGTARGEFGRSSKDCRLSAVALRASWRAARLPLAEALKSSVAHLERLYLEDLMSHRDPVEGIRAFLERRSPQWENR